MSYASLFASLGASWESRADGLVDELRTKQAAEQNIQAVEDTWDETIEDGIVSSEELARLRPLLKKAGMLEELAALESRMRDGVIQGEGIEAADEDLRSGGDRLRRLIQQGSGTLNIELQVALTEMTRFYGDASDAIREENEIYDNAVANILA